MSEEKDTQILNEIRRQGRAAVAAQAAAEACLDAISQMKKHAQDEPAGGEAERSLVRALLPLADSLDRVVQETRGLAASAAEPGRVMRWLGATARRPELESLSSAVVLLRAQLDDALSAAGVEIDRRTRVPIDGDAHRVVATTPGHAGLVVEVVRPGYVHRGARLREADVVGGK